MPERPDSTIAEALTRCRGRLAAGENPWDIYAELRQNGYFAAYLAKYDGAVASALTSDNLPALTKTIELAFSDIEAATTAVVQVTAHENEEYLQAADRAQQVDPEVLHEQTAALNAAATSVKERPLARRPANRAFINQLVHQWVVQNKAQLSAAGALPIAKVEQDLAVQLETALAESPGAAPDAVLTRVITQTPVLAQYVAGKRAEELTRDIGSYQQYEQEIGSGIVQATLSSPSAKATLAHIERSLDASVAAGSTPAEVKRLMADAINIGFADVVASLPEEQRARVAQEVSTNLFSFLAKTPLQRAVAPVADWFNTVVLPKGEFMDRILDRTMRRVGGDAVSSPLFADVTRGQQLSATESRSAASSLFRSVGNLFSDVTGTVFRGPMDESVVTYVQMITAVSPVPGGGRPHIPSFEQWYYSVSAMSDIGQLVFRLGTKKSAEAVAEAGLKGAASKLSSEGVKKGLTALAAKLGLSAVAAGSGPPGWVVAAVTWIGSSFIGKAAGFLWRGVKSFFGASFMRLMSGDGQLSWKNDWPLLMAGIVLLPIVLMVLPITSSVLGGSMHQEMVRDTALVSSMKGEAADQETSQFMNVTKTADVTSATNQQLPLHIHYTVTITATSDRLENITIWNTTTVITKTGVTTVERDVNGNSIRSLTPSATSLDPGGTTTVTYEIVVDQPDSVVTDSIVVHADVPGKGKQNEAASAVANVTIGSPPAGVEFTCDGGGAKIVAPGATEHLLVGAGRTPWCITPTMIVIHWSGGWANAQGNQATYNTLVARGLSCQYATDPGGVWQMQQMWEKKVELAYCVGGNNNNYAINNEIAGAYFDNPQPGRMATDEQVKMAIDNTCFLMRQYHIPAGQIFGHYQLWPGKPDPGPHFLANFIDRVKQTCPGAGE